MTPGGRGSTNPFLGNSKQLHSQKWSKALENPKLSATSVYIQINQFTAASSSPAPLRSPGSQIKPERHEKIYGVNFAACRLTRTLSGVFLAKTQLLPIKILQILSLLNSL